jgi:hypothetical protein
LRKTLFSVALMAAALMVLPQVSRAQAAAGQSAQPAQSSDSTTDQDIQMLRSDLRGQKKQIVAQNLTLTPAEAEKFWPVYDQYSNEVSKLNDTRLALIKQYAASYDNMTDAQANSLIKQALDLDGSYVKLRQAWVPKFEKVISAKQTAAFFQIDRRLGLLMDLQLAANIPLAKQ